MFQLKIIEHGKALPFAQNAHQPHWHWIIFHSQCRLEINATRSRRGKKFKFSIQALGVWLRSSSMAKSLSNLAIFLRALIHQFLFCWLRDWRHGLAAMIFMIPTVIVRLCLFIQFSRDILERNRKQSPNACTNIAFLFSRKASKLRSTSGIHSNLGYPRSTSLITEIECWLNGSSEQARQKRFVEKLVRVSCSRSPDPRNSKPFVN